MSSNVSQAKMCWTLQMPMSQAERPLHAPGIHETLWPTLHTLCQPSIDRGIIVRLSPMPEPHQIIPSTKLSLPSMASPTHAFRVHILGFRVRHFSPPQPSTSSSFETPCLEPDSVGQSVQDKTVDHEEGDQSNRYPSKWGLNAFGEHQIHMNKRIPTNCL